MRDCRGPCNTFKGCLSLRGMKTLFDLRFESGLEAELGVAGEGTRRKARGKIVDHGVQEGLQRKIDYKEIWKAIEFNLESDCQVHEL